MKKEETKKQEPKLIKELVNNIGKESFVIRQLWEYEGRKFRFIFENSNGTPVGFDSKHCIMVFNLASDEWKPLADKKEINGLAKGEINCSDYYANPLLLKTWAGRFMEACKEYIKLIY